MASKNSDPMRIWPKQAKDAFEFWISLWPVAPLFGVKWRLAEPLSTMIPGLKFMARAGTIEKEPARPAPKPEPASAAIKIDSAAEDAEVVKAAAAHPAPEPAVAAAAPEPAPEPAPAPAAAEVAAPGDNELTRIKGIGPGLAKQLNEVGITNLEQLASLSPEHVKALDAGLEGIKGRCSRDDWVGQAKALVG